MEVDPDTRTGTPPLRHAQDSPTASWFAFRYRGILAALPIIAAALCSWRECENEVAIWGTAGAVFAGGMALRIWAQQHLHFRLHMKRDLTTTGPYALVRNPIYIANTLICIALTVASEVLWLVPVTLVWCCLVFSLVVRHEEAYLRKRYGRPYLEYLETVPRWWPRLSGAGSIRWTTDYLRASLRVEAYNVLFMVPFVLKELLRN